ncbi:S8 family peptidase [Deinococcus sp.]|uniref:S8 family peptidase n=1 Tax=Deinococcus sp. TaxID=47478 RepID=UPI003C799DE4
MKRLLPLLTCTLLAACGAGGPQSAFTLGGAVVLPGSALGAASLYALSVQPNSSVQPDWSRSHVPGEVLVVGEDGAPLPGTLGALKVEALDDAGLRRVKTPAGESDETFAARLGQALGTQAGLSVQALAARGVYVQPNYLYRALSVPNDPGYPTNAGVTVQGALYDQDYLTRINALAGWDAAQAAGDKALAGAVTAVLDTGVDRSHPELQGRLLPGYDFCATDDGNGGCLSEDADPSEAAGGGGHGTSITGILGALGNNGKGLVGLTWSGQNLLPVKVFDEAGNAATSTLAKGIDYALAQGARVINMSLGVPGSNPDPALAARIKAASDAGAVLVAAAGNTPGDGLYYPASDPNVLATGAIGGTDPTAAGYNDLACYSARPKGNDKALDLVAPGGNAGTGTARCVQSSAYDTLVLAPGGGYALSAGTSEATPMVSGAAALALSVRPDLKASQVRALLKSSARTVSGGRLLDVGAAIRAALALPQNAPRAYTLSVQAGGASQTLSGTLPIGSNSVPYTIQGVPAGQTSLSASLTLDGKIYTGALVVNVTGNRSSLNIQVK